MSDIRDKLRIISPVKPSAEEKTRRSTVKITQCQRCGSCCTAASPTLLKEDMALYLSNLLNDTNTYTLRIGEPLYNRKEQELYFAPFEMIKVEEDAGCSLYEGSGECSIYEQRPLQCREYRCWNTEPPLEGIEDKRLTRQDIFGQVAPIYEIIIKHEDLCSYEKFIGLLETLEQGSQEQVEEILEMLKFDSTVRDFVRENFGVNAKSLDLLFGRPMADTLDFFGFELIREDDGITLRAKVQGQ